MSLAPSEIVRNEILQAYGAGPEDYANLADMLDKLEDAIDKEYGVEYGAPRWWLRIIWALIMMLFIIPIVGSISAGIWIGSHHHTLFKVAFLVFYGSYVLAYFALELSFFKFLNWIGRKYVK